MSNASEAQSNALALSHMGLVESIAAKLRRSMALPMPHEDLVAYGTQGLIEAARRYDPTRGIAFSTFAYYRIRGAIFDGVRQMAWFPRSVIEKRMRAEERVNAYLQAEAETCDNEGAPDRDDEAAGADKEAALSELATLLSNVATIHVASLDANDNEPADEASSPEETLAQKSLAARVRQAVEALPERERYMVEQHYFHHVNLTEIGKTMGLSKSWSSRLHARAVDLLRRQLVQSGDIESVRDPTAHPPPPHSQ
jgi:RNA polymerase sigma factor for flagellar operon FliA